MPRTKFQIDFDDFDGYQAQTTAAFDSATNRKLEIAVLPHQGLAVYRVYKNRELINEFPVDRFLDAVDCFNKV